MAMNQNYPSRPNESVCIQTERIYDSCKSKECAENLRVYFSDKIQCLIDNANNVRIKCAEVLFVDTDVDKIQFNKCYYNVDMTFYFKVTVEISTGCDNTTTADGLCIFNKNAMMFGSEVCSHVFSSKDSCSGHPKHSRNSAMPTAVVETLDPVALDAKLTETCCGCGHPVCSCICGKTIQNIPGSISGAFQDGLSDSGNKRVCVTLGLFTFIRLQRSTQLLIPCFDFCIPDKACVSTTGSDDPCSFFEKLDFPVDSFFPPSTCGTETKLFGSCRKSCCDNDTASEPPRQFRQKD